MSTFYDQALKILGTNQTTTSPTFKNALDAQELNDAITTLTHFFFAALAVLAVYFLWKISRQNQKIPSLNHPTLQHSNAPQQPNHEPADETNTEARPQMPGSPPRLAQTLKPTKAGEPPIASSIPDSSYMLPDSSYMPKF
jgi:hypothetical protein